MEKVTNRQKHINLPFWITLIIIVVSDDTLFFGTNGDRTFITIKYIILIALTGLMAFKYISFKVPTSFLTLLTMCGLVLFSAFINDDFRAGNLYKCVILILAYEIAYQVDFNDFAYWFEKIMFVLAFASLAGMMAGMFAKPILSILPEFTNSAGMVFHNAFLFLSPIQNGIVRNYGIFREPGVYQMFLIMAILMYLYRYDEIKNYKLIIYITAIIFTYSTTGYIALALVLILYTIKEGVSIQNNKKSSS